MANCALILLAGGSSSRMEGDIADKSLETLCGKPVLQYSLEAFQDSRRINTIAIVYRDSDQRNQLEEIADIPNIIWVQGGPQRQDSVFNALNALENENIDYVFIHDSARPLISVNGICDVYDSLMQYPAVVLAHPATDTMRQIPMAGQPSQATDFDRNTLWAMETPQAFKFSLIHEAYCKVQEQGQIITDDIAAVVAQGHPIVVVHNDEPNLKLTQPEDFAIAEALLDNYVTV